MKQIFTQVKKSLSGAKFIEILFCKWNLFLFSIAFRNIVCFLNWSPIKQKKKKKKHFKGLSLWSNNEPRGSFLTRGP